MAGCTGKKKRREEQRTTLVSRGRCVSIATSGQRSTELEIAAVGRLKIKPTPGKICARRAGAGKEDKLKRWEISTPTAAGKKIHG
jgi:hypothetical protein